MVNSEYGIARIFSGIFLLFLCLNLGAQTEDGGETAAKPLWRQAMGGVIIGIPTVQAQSIVVVLDGGNIKAYSAQGKPLWTFSARGRLSPYVSRSLEGTSYISRTGGIFIAVNRSGRELWRANPGGPLVSPALCGWDGRIFIPTDRRISCFTASGQRLWQLTLDSSLSLPLKPDQKGGLIAVLGNGTFLSVDPFGFSTAYGLRDDPAAILSLPPVKNKGSYRFLVLYKNTRAEIIDPDAESGRPYTLPRLPGPPLAATSRMNRAAVLLEDGTALLISGDDGSFLWTGESHMSRQRNGGDLVSVLYDERGIYFLSRSGASGFTEDGRRLWLIRLDGAAAIPAFDDEGLLYSGGSDWILNAYKLEDRVRRGRQSFYGPMSEGRYGTGDPPPSPWASYHYRFEEGELKARFAEIDNAVKKGSLGSSELAYTAYLMEVISAGMGQPGASKFHPPVQPAYRARALELLGNIGSRETLPFLADIFSRESDPVVRARTAQAVGAIGIDPEGFALRAFTQSIYKAREDDQVLMALCSAIGALCRFSGPPLSDTGVRLLNTLSAGDRPGPVQAQARRELKTLR
ncbi:MAG: PQQ-binding-like beta-propeller repeat protein [Treponema sp.]|nr:PQQ-binding-like beta-propeller repeat protein [Treponema sp.]